MMYMFFYHSVSELQQAQSTVCCVGIIDQLTSTIRFENKVGYLQ